MNNQFLGSARTSPRYARLIEQLQLFMLEGQFKNGDKLPSERSLAESFGVSRSSIREAIRVLAEKGHLESRHGDGTYVRVPDLEPLTSAILQAVDAEFGLFEQIIEFREAVEPVIAALAAVRRTQEQLDRLKIIVCDQQRRRLQDINDGDLDAQFHLALAECTGNQLFVETIIRLNELYSSCRDAELRDEAWGSFSSESHLRIIDALEHRAPEEARQRLLEHLHTVRQTHLFSYSKDK